MKINLNRIFAVISLLVLATICLQVYWNYKNYLSNKIRLHNEVQIAYDFALEKYFDEASKETFISVFSKDSTVEMKDFIAKIKADSIFGKKMKNENMSLNYNLGSGEGFTVKEIIEKTKTITGVDFTVEEEEPRAGDPAVLVADSEKAGKELGWKPEYDLDSIISSAWKWELNRKY